MKGAATFIDKRIINNSRLIITACKSHLSSLNSLGGEGKVQMLYPATDPATELPKHKDDYMVVATAWKEGKEPEYLFEIAKRDKDLKIVVAGSWHPEEYEQCYIAQVKSLGFTEQIEVTGALSEEKMSEVFSNALFFLQFKADIGFGMPALEAAANGCTFVIPEGQGVCDLFVNGVHGFYMTKDKDLDTILSYVKLFKTEKGVAAAMGLAAWEAVKQKYSWAEHANNISRVCRNITSR
jgi:glycosyltransferase involved in cell wall biosynthesis